MAIQLNTICTSLKFRFFHVVRQFVGMAIRNFMRYIYFSFIVDYTMLNLLQGQAILSLVILLDDIMLNLPSPYQFKFYWMTVMILPCTSIAVFFDNTILVEL